MVLHLLLDIHIARKYCFNIAVNFFCMICYYYNIAQHRTYYYDSTLYSTLSNFEQVRTVYCTYCTYCINLHVKHILAQNCTTLHI